MHRTIAKSKCIDIYGEEAVHTPPPANFGAPLHVPISLSGAQPIDRSPENAQPAIVLPPPPVILTDLSSNTLAAAEPCDLEGQRPRRSHKPRPGFALEDIKVCTGCGQNARGDANVIKCKNVHCSTEWVRALFLLVYLLYKFTK